MAVEVTIGGNGELFVGEDKIIRLAVLDKNGAPVDIAGRTILLDVRKSDIAADPAIFSKLATIIGVFNASVSLNTQRAEVVFTDTELNTVKGKTYRHSWKQMDDGIETVLVYGDFVMQKATAP